MRTWLVLALFAACRGNDVPDGDGGTIEGPPPAQSGTRLRLAWFDFDGTRLWQGRPAELEYTYGEPNADIDAFFDAERQETCTPLRWSDGIIRCTPANGDGIPPDELAVIDTVVETAVEGGGGRVHRRYHTSGDGMSVLVGLDDAQFGESRLQLDRTSELVLPLYAAFAGQGTLYYADAGCSQAYVMLAAGSPAPKVAASAEPRLYPVGARASAPPRYERRTNGCGMITPPQADFYRVDFANPVEPVALVRSVDDDSTRRIQTVHATTDDLTMPVRRLYDAQFATSCVPWLFPDGVYRCAPLGANLEYLVYSDYLCQSPIEVANVFVDPPPTLVFENGESGRPVEVRELLGRVTEPMYAGGPTNCVPYEQPNEYRVGRVVDWSELATATLATD